MHVVLLYSNGACRLINVYLKKNTHNCMSHAIQTRQCTITQHLGAFVQTLLQWKSNKCYICRVCACSLNYPGCNAHAQYCYLWVVCLALHYLSKMARLEEKKVIESKMRVLVFSETFLIQSEPSNTSQMLTVPHVKYPSFLPDCNET